MVRLLVLATLLLATPAEAHGWYTNLYNEAGESCCNGADCAEIPDSDVTPVPGGYQVHTLFFSPSYTGGTPVTGFVPNSRAKPAKEGGSYHLCYWAAQIKCFFYPAPAY